MKDKEKEKDIDNLKPSHLDKQDRRLIKIKRKIIIYEQIIRNGQIIKRLITEISK